MQITLMDYIVDQALMLVPVLYILGMMLKNTEKIKDWTIPWILLACGIGCCIAILGFNLQSVLQGVLVTGAAVFGNQLVKQSTVRKEEEEREEREEREEETEEEQREEETKEEQ